MSIHKYKDWAGWWDGLRSQMMQAGAKSVVTTLTTFMTTNAADSLHIPALKGIGMSWETAIVAMLAQFTIHVIYAAAVYVQNKPDPNLIECDTSIITKDEITKIPNTDLPHVP